MITTAETAAPYILAVVLLAALVALSAAHIPGLRTLTGAAPLQREEDDQLQDLFSSAQILALAAADAPAEHVASAAAAAAITAADGGEAR